MKFWEKFQPEQFKNNETKAWWWWVCAAFGFVIGLTAVAFIVALVFLFLGWGFSLLWNYAVAPTFSISDLTTYTASVILFLIFAFGRFIKWVLR
jgi:hypothetical protein